MHYAVNTRHDVVSHIVLQIIVVRAIKFWYWNMSDEL